jgi:hypothetical protein
MGRLGFTNGRQGIHDKLYLLVMLLRILPAAVVQAIGRKEGLRG